MFEVQFSSFGDFLAMGGYAFNVWSVYFLFMIFLIVNIVSPLQRNKRIMKDLKRRTSMIEHQETLEKSSETTST